MKSAATICVLAIALCEACRLAAVANVPAPPTDLPPGRKITDFRVERDANKDISVLYIPRSAINSAGAVYEPLSESQSAQRLQYAVAACCLSLGIAGACLSRGGVRLAMLSATAAIAIFIAGFVGFRMGSESVQASSPSRESILSSYERVMPEIVENGYEFRLVIGTKPRPLANPNGTRDNLR